jgi:chromosome segregation ATPase
VKPIEGDVAMADEAEQQRQELHDIEAQIAEVRSSIDELREQVGGQSYGAQDAEDVAAALTNIEEQEGVLSALEQRRETVMRRAGWE